MVKVPVGLCIFLQIAALSKALLLMSPMTVFLRHHCRGGGAACGAGVLVFIVWKEGMPDWREEKRVAQPFPSELQPRAGVKFKRGFLSSVCLFFKWGLGFVYFCLSGAEGGGEGNYIYCSLYLSKLRVGGGLTFLHCL